MHKDIQKYPLTRNLLESILSKIMISPKHKKCKGMMTGSKNHANWINLNLIWIR